MKRDPALAPLFALARHAGVQRCWRDAWEMPRTLTPDALRAVLTAMGLPCATPDQCEATSAWLVADDAAQGLPPLVTADTGMPLHVPWRKPVLPHPYLLELEDGGSVSGTAQPGPGATLEIPAIDVCGYHRLLLGETATTVAVAPPRCFSVADALARAGFLLSPASGRAVGGEGQRASSMMSFTSWKLPHAPPAPLPTGGREETIASDVIRRQPPRPHHGRPWGLAVQLYALRRDAPAGIGDFTALAQCCRDSAREGADVVAINPVHAGFTAHPERYSPYSPSSRLFHNPLYTDPATLFGEAAIRQALAELRLGDELAALDARDEIDWPGVARLRQAVLRWCWQHHEARLTMEAQHAFTAFRARGGTALHAHAMFEALQAHRRADLGDGPLADEATDWRRWPEDLQSPGSAAIATFANAHADEIGYHAFLQWLAAHGLAEAQRAAREAGMAIGLLADLAIGTDPRGSHAWMRQHEIFPGLCVGAPPDIYNPRGQDWGLAVFSPRGLRHHGYAAFLEMLRANLAHAGGLRIDHVLGLARMWLVPSGAPATDGAYLTYPLDDLLRLVALESWRHEAVIVGENLGTVPPTLDTALAARGVLGIDILWFQREATPAGADDDAVPAFRPPAQWPREAVAMTTTHDLPTVCGWWAGRDIAWRARLGQLGADETEAGLMQSRARERSALWQALETAGLVSGPEPGPAHAPLEAVLAWLGTARTPLRLVPVEDLLGETEQPNLPGTIDEHPNWRRRLPADARALLDGPVARASVRALLHGARGRRGPGHAGDDR